MKLSHQSLWVEQLLTHLAQRGEIGEGAAVYVRQRHIPVGFHRQSSGARWTVNKRIQLHPRYAQSPPSDPYALSLIVHEVQHLRQGWLTALSVYGELGAWQAQFGFLRSVEAGYLDNKDPGGLVAELLALRLGWDRSVLSRARQLMRRYAGSQYRIDLLPLYPLKQELVFRLLGRIPGP